jgi:hypothetical protein
LQGLHEIPCVQVYLLFVAVRKGNCIETRLVKTAWKIWQNGVELVWKFKKWKSIVKFFTTVFHFEGNYFSGACLESHFFWLLSSRKLFRIHHQININIVYGLLTVNLRYDLRTSSTQQITRLGFNLSHGRNIANFQT